MSQGGEGGREHLRASLPSSCLVDMLTSFITTVNGTKVENHFFSPRSKIASSSWIWCVKHNEDNALGDEDDDVFPVGWLFLKTRNFMNSQKSLIILGILVKNPRGWGFYLG